MFGWNLQIRQGHLQIVSIGTKQISGRIINQVFSNCAIKSTAEKNCQNKNCQIWKKIDIRNLFWKEGRLAVGIWPLWLGQSMVSDDMCDQLFSALFDEWQYFANCSLSRFGEWQQRVVSLPEERLKSHFTNFLKTI